MSDDLYQALNKGVEVDGYRIEKVIGSGGFGITYLGLDIGLDKPVAIKEYLPRDLAVRIDDQSVRAASSSDKTDFTWGLERFLDEARLLAKFDHKNIVSVYRFFEAHGTAYIVMEYIDGETLSERLKRDKTLSFDQLKSIIDPILAGLDVVHKGDFLHRDIKPGNIIIRENGTPVLIDFGAARQAVGARSRSVTAIVTPGYAPIEQYSTRGKQGPWTDIYALGAIAYRAIAGETPVDATERVRRDPLVPLMEQDIPKALGYSEPFLKAVDKALSVDEEARPQSIAEWRDMLAGQVGVEGVSSNVVDETAKTEYLPRNNKDNNTSRKQTAKPAHHNSSGNSKSKKGFIFGGVAAMAITGLAIGLVSMGGSERPIDDGDNGVTKVTVAPDQIEAWGAAKALGTIEAYESFLGKWPNSEHATEAKSSIDRLKNSEDDEAFEAAKAKALVSGYGEYVQNFPKGKHHEAADEGAWSSAQRQNTIQAYEAYLSYFPESAQIDAASEAIQSLKDADIEAQEKAQVDAKAAADAAALIAAEEAAKEDAFKLTCEGGNAEDCHAKGYHQFHHQKNYGQGRLLYQKACDGGWVASCNELGYSYSSGLGVPVDYSRARTLFSKACDGYYVSGCGNLGLLYYRGNGVSVDYSRAQSLFRKSCEGGILAGCFNLGAIYFGGIGVSVDYSRARPLFSKACEGGVIAGCNGLGEIYRDGLGVSVDYSRARNLFSNACDGGNEKACDNLEAMK